MRKLFFIVIVLMISLPAFTQPVPPLFVEMTMRDVPEAPSLIGAVRTRYMGINSTGLSSTTTLNLFQDATFRASHRRSEPRPSGETGTIWIGELIDEPYSSVVLVVSPDGINGQVNKLGTAFTIETVQPGIVAITEVDGRVQRATLKNDTDVMPVPLSTRTTADIGDRYIDVMVVYTPAAAATGDVLSKIDSMVAVTNQTYAASDVSQRIRLVHTAQVDYLETEWDILANRNHLTFLAGVYDPTGYLDEVHPLRDQYKADLVVLLIYNENQPCGKGWTLANDNPANLETLQKFGMSVVNIMCWSPYFEFTHELGHNMGGGHDHANLGSLNPVYNYSYGYQDPDQQFVTIMALSVNGYCPGYNQDKVCVPIGHWSNPLATHNGKPLGDLTTDMVQTLNKTASLVSSFRLAQLKPFDLIAPIDQQPLTEPSMTFQWHDEGNASEYILKVSTVSGYRYKAKINALACVEGVCSFNPSGDSLWKPPHNELLRWKVIATASADRRLSSVKWRIVAAFLPNPVTVFEPVVTGSTITFSWHDDSRVDDFHLKVIDPNGSRLYRQWQPSISICSGGVCSVTVEATVSGSYQWRVKARRDETTGRTRSPKGTLTVNLLIH